MNVALNLEQLKLKRIPKTNIGVVVKIMEIRPGQQPVGEPELYEKKIQKPVVIMDSRNKHKIDRDLILNRLYHRKIAKLPVVEEQESDLDETLFTTMPGKVMPIVSQDDANAPQFKIGALIPAITLQRAITLQPAVNAQIIIKKKKIKAVVDTDETGIAQDVVDKDETAVEPVVVGKIIKRRKIVRTDIAPGKIDLMAAKIGAHRIIDRLPKDKEKIIIKASHYYMNNRKLFVKQLADLFRPYRDELAENAENISCKSQSKSKDFELLTHQKIVRDYLNIYTPYRGLLLYHGLGSGKTCTSIALAEGMKSHKRVFVMTPASLKMNFFSEMKKCGDALYKKNQYWEFISIEGKPDYINILSTALQLPTDYINTNKGAWLVDVSKPSNFAEISTEHQVEIDEQLNQMIRSKYRDINYNGLNLRKLEELTGGFTRNPFDDSVVVIDEAHNFVSRIVNKIPKRASGMAEAKKTISYMLYEYLMDAKNARIVLLTGTPIINYPNEIGILFNILRGYIKTWTIPVRIKTTNTINRDTILDMFDAENFRTFDYVEYSGNKLTITRNPFGFINMKKRGAAKQHRGGSNKKTKVKRANVKKPKQNKTKKNKEPVDELYNIKNDVIVLNETKINELDGNVSNANQSEFDKSESSEYDGFFKDNYAGENSTQYGGLGQDVFDRYNGVHLDETGNITDTEFLATIKRILGKNDIEIIESGIEIVNNKALPDDSDSFMEKFIEPGANEMKNEHVFKRRILGLTSYFRSAQEKLLPQYILNEQGGIFHIVRAEMSNYQFGIYEQIRKEEEDREKNIRKKKQKQANKGEELFNIASTYRIFSRASCNFAFPNPPGRPLPNKKPKKTDELAKSDELELDVDIDENDFDAVPLNEQTITDDYATEEDIEQKRGEEGKQADYQQRIERAMKFLEYNAAAPRELEYLTPEALETYSPKFLSILENIADEDNLGLHLIYSQFRTIEGIGILKLILEANGFAQFKIQKNSDDLWTIVDTPDLPKFVLYTGTETVEEKEIIRNIYNGDWEYVPASITSQLREKSENNMYGEIIKILMITASGAEGINLKNTRFVHIVEPYWHMVRIEQVIGRARRICSHEELPVELRNIKVFLYLSILPTDLKTDKAKFTKHIELLNRDISRLDGKISLSTDESLFESATIKDTINRNILTAMKETAMDCSLYAAGNKTEDLVCYGFGKVESNQFASYPTFERDQTEKDDMNVKTQKLKLSNITIKGIKYAWNETTNELFDYESFKRAKKSGEDLLYVGKLIRDGPRTFRIDTEAERL